MMIKMGIYLFKKKYSDYSELLFSTFNVAMTVTGMVMLARITPSTANSLSMSRLENMGFI